MKQSYKTAQTINEFMESTGIHSEPEIVNLLIAGKEVEDDKEEERMLRKHTLIEKIKELELTANEVKECLIDMTPQFEVIR